VRQALAGQRRNGRTTALEEMVISRRGRQFKLRHYHSSSGVILRLHPTACASSGAIDLYLLFCLTPIVGGRDQRQCALNTNQDHGPNLNGESHVPVHLAPAPEDLIRAMDNSAPLESIPLANERIDNVDFDGGVVLDVLNRLR